MQISGDIDMVGPPKATVKSPLTDKEMSSVQDVSADE